MFKIKAIPIQAISRILVDHLMVFFSILNISQNLLPYLGVLVFFLNYLIYVPKEVPKELTFIGQIKVKGRIKIGMEFISSILLIIAIYQIQIIFVPFAFFIIILTILLNRERILWLASETDQPKFADAWINYKRKFPIHNGIWWYFVILSYILVFYLLYIYVLLNII